ncbi:MAG: hypothetical protein M2R46_05166 [Verrucomicrobia subdivision 3 bacterium]|nr:hypothetical protein [Limisphaerales bacterium]
MGLEGFPQDELKVAEPGPATAVEPGLCPVEGWRAEADKRTLAKARNRIRLALLKTELSFTERIFGLLAWAGPGRYICCSWCSILASLRERKGLYALVVRRCAGGSRLLG